MTQPSTTPASACRHTKPTRRSRPKPDPSGPADAPTDPSYSRLTLPSAYDGHPHAPIGGSGLSRTRRSSRSDQRSVFEVRYEPVRAVIFNATALR
jgi:hypothetical protein